MDGWMMLEVTDYTSIGRVTGDEPYVSADSSGCSWV